jgi:aminotransferase EvaB
MNDLQRVYAAYADVFESETKAVLQSGWWLNGPQTRVFCEAFASSLGVAHCIGVGNGTDALEIALRALLAADSRFGSGEDTTSPEIITVANAGGYATTACYLAGCVPVYADIEVSSQLMSTPSAVAAISKQTAAVVVTHLYGGLVDVPALRRAMDDAEHHNVPILEDCAQAHGLSGCGDRAGTFGKIATFSFYPTKNLGAIGDGGAVVTNDADCADHVRRLHQYGWTEKYRVGTPFGRNSRLDEIQAAILGALLPDLETANQRRRDILNVYSGALREPSCIVKNDCGTVAHLAVVMTEERDALRHHLESHDVATEIHYPILDCNQTGWHDLKSRVGPTGLATSEASVQRILSLPCFPSMTDEEVDIVRDALATFGE